MAQLSNAHGETILINRYHTFGRDPLVAKTVLKDIRCCELHASIFFEQGIWYLKDHSINGTVIDNKTILNERLPLADTKKIQMGNHVWSVDNNFAPTSFLVQKKNVFLLQKESTYEVISKKQKALLFFEKKVGWRMKINSKVMPIQAKEELEYNKQKWHFVDNEPLEETLIVKEYSIKNKIAVKLVLSENYEHVKISLSLNGSVYVLPYKSHNLTLYLLAKKYHIDQEQKINENDWGWIRTEDILRIMSKELMRDCDVYFLNVQIHRIRKQLKKLNLVFDRIIERRKSEIRIRVAKLTIEGPTYGIYN